MTSSPAVPERTSPASVPEIVAASPSQVAWAIAPAKAVGAGNKTWRAYLSTSTVDAKSRIGNGPWHNFKGEQIAANKVIGTRAALAYDLDTARLGREHNDANVIAIGARMHTEEEALELVRLFLATPFSGDPRHARRIGLLADYEKTRSSAQA